MMTKATDYKFYPPPSNVISGEIIPTSDIDEVIPKLRYEDYYYLREFARFALGTSVQLDPNPNWVSYYQFSQVAALADVLWNARSSNNRFVYINDQLPEQGLDSGMRTNTSTTVVQMLRDTYPNLIFRFDDLTENVLRIAYHQQYNTDDIRKLYYNLNKIFGAYMRYVPTGIETTNYHQVHRACAVDIGSQYQQLQWAQDSNLEPYVSGTRPVYVGRNTATDYIRFMYQDTQESVGSQYLVQLFNKYDHGWKYCQRVNAPQTDLYGQVDFSSCPISKGYAQVQTTFYRAGGGSTPSAYYNTRLLPMERISGTDKWRIKLYDSTFVRQFASSIGVSLEDTDWGESADSFSMSVNSVYEFWCQTEDEYCKLPDEWQYQPS